MSEHLDDTPARPLRVTLLCCALQGIGGGLGWSLLPPLLPDVARDLSISHGMSGLVWGAAPLGIALAAIFGGAAVDRYGPRRVAGLAMLAGALACAARAFAVDAWSLAVLMFAFGLHIGFVAPAIPKALAGHVPLGKLGRANGAALLTYTLGTALTVWLARTHLAPAVGGWRAAMVWAGGAMAVAGVAWWLLVSDRIALEGHARLGDVLGLLRNGELRKVALVHFLLFGGYLAMLGLLPRALIDGGVPPQEVGEKVALWLVAAGIMNLGGPWLSDRIGRRRPILVVGAAVTATGLFLMAMAPPQAGLWLLVVAALGGGAFAPLLFTLPVEIEGVGAQRVGAALGLLMLVGQAGGFLLPVVTGWTLGGFGFTGVLVLLAVAHALILVPSLALRETGPAARRPGGSYGIVRTSAGV